MDIEIKVTIVEIIGVLLGIIGIGTYSLVDIHYWSIPTAIICLGVAIFKFSQGLEDYLIEKGNK